jgi:glycosyltransferase involved in cell wall biosynthesis
MKILHLSNVIGESKGGGVHEVVSNFYKYQKSLKHEPHIWFPGNEIDAASIKLDNNIKGLTTYGKIEHGFVKGLFTKLPSDIESFEVIHQHGIWKPISMFNKKIRNRTKLKTVIQPHGYLEPYRLKISKYKKKAAFLLFEKSNLDGASALVACSENEGFKLKNMFPGKEVAVIHNGISDDFFLHPSLKHEKPEDKRYMLFLSQIIPIKGLERLFKVISEIGISKFDNWELLIAGYEEKKYTDILKRKVEELKLQGIVKFVGSKLGEEKYEIFDNADVFILPTYNENYGIVVAEALARGVPAITTKGTPWEELNIKKCGFWVDNDEEGLRNGLLDVLDMSKEELQIMGQNGKKLIESKYLWSKTTLPTIDLYNYIINGGHKPDFFL